MPDTTLTTAEAARELKISVRAVQRLCDPRRKGGPLLKVARKVGRVLLLDARSVRECDPPRRGRPRDPSAPHSRFRRA